MPPRKTWTVEMLAELEELLRSGKTLKECGEHFNVSRQRVDQVRRNGIAGLTRWDFGTSVRSAQKPKPARREKWPATLEAAYARVLRNKKAHAKFIGAEFDLTLEDVEWVDVCPALGIQLDWLSRKRSDNTPSFDRIDPSKGYVKGNVVILSLRANRIKNDATADELYALASWLKVRAGG